jgi:hypothetical protein
MADVVTGAPTSPTVQPDPDLVRDASLRLAGADAARLSEPGLRAPALPVDASAFFARADGTTAPLVDRPSAAAAHIAGSGAPAGAAGPGAGNGNGFANGAASFFFFAALLCAALAALARTSTALKRVPTFYRSVFLVLLVERPG